jgi:hypothetical protein
VLAFLALLAGGIVLIAIREPQRFWQDALVAGAGYRGNRVPPILGAAVACYAPAKTGGRQ